MNAKWRITFFLMVGLLTFVGTLYALDSTLENQAQQSVTAAWPQASTIYVDRDAVGPTHNGLSWATAYTDVQRALTTAISGTEIWVAEGVYYPGAYVTSTFVLTDGVALYGGFTATETQRTQRDWAAHVTILSGDIDRNDLTNANGIVTDTVNITGTNAYHVVTGSGVTLTAILDGFTITAGKTVFCGGGMYNTSGSNPALTNVTFSGNWANNCGGGMYNEYSNPVLTAGCATTTVTRR